MLRLMSDAQRNRAASVACGIRDTPVSVSTAHDRRVSSPRTVIEL
jgi:hypothetical protein